MQGATPGANSLSIGGLTASRLLIPTLSTPSFAAATSSGAGSGGGSGALPRTSTNGPGNAWLVLWVMMGATAIAFLTSFRAFSSLTRSPRLTSGQ
jgi:hypothetical protein